MGRTSEDCSDPLLSGLPIVMIPNYPTASHKQPFVHCANTPRSSTNSHSRIQLKQRIDRNKNEDTIMFDHVTLSQENHKAQEEILKSHAFHAL